MALVPSIAPAETPVPTPGKQRGVAVRILRRVWTYTEMKVAAAILAALILLT